MEEKKEYNVIEHSVLLSIKCKYYKIYKFVVHTMCTNQGATPPNTPSKEGRT